MTLQQLQRGKASIVHHRPDAEVLILDDDTFMLKLLGHMLGELGFPRTTACTSGDAALAALDGRGCAPALILFDLNMPGIDGMEFLRHLHSRDFSGSLILVSGEDDRMLQAAQSLARAHRVAILGSLRKPVAREDLAKILDQWQPHAHRKGAAHKAAYGAEQVRQAIANGELVNHYQPKVEVASGRLKGVEALVRWRHPVDGMVFPDQFIGVAEEHGLIGALTTVVLGSALAQARRWRDAGLELTVSVNVSMDDLASLEFPDSIFAQTQSHGLSPRDVIVEVTESRLSKDLRSPLEVLARLRLKRFGLSIDDFGTGHSSLAQLRDFPFDELKVDRSFVHGASNNKTLRAIYEASLNLARQLGMRVVAEGVEDWSDWELLRRSGCAMAQGYFIARPMPAEALPAWALDWQGRVAGFAAIE
jgi:EAL domain-containing protein (putative c-di-GMP-specific phosphodiesterase class I)/FixJ family two-component response regulator